MYTLNKSDKVQLKADRSTPERADFLPAGAKGQILDRDAQGYTVVFEGHITPVGGLTDEDVVLDGEHAAE